MRCTPLTWAIFRKWFIGPAGLRRTRTWPVQASIWSSPLGCLLARRARRMFCGWPLSRPAMAYPTRRPSYEPALALQLRFFTVSLAGERLMASPPRRPCDDGCGLDRPSGQAIGNTTDLLHRPANHERGFSRTVFGGVARVSALWRTTASKVKASMTVPLQSLPADGDRVKPSPFGVEVTR